MSLMKILTFDGLLSAPVAASLLLVLSYALWGAVTAQQDEKSPESYPDFPIPGVSNAYQYIFKNFEFLQWARTYLNEKREIMTFWMGPQRVYIVTGAKNAHAVVRGSGHLSSDAFVLDTLSQLDGVTPKDFALFKKDKSGRAVIPRDNTPEADRFWHGNHKIMVEHLSGTLPTTILMKKFCELFTARIEKKERGEWETLQLWQFVRKELVEDAMIALAGPKLLELNPGLLDTMWEFDGMVYPLLFHVPKFLYRQAYDIRDRFHDMGIKWLRYAFEQFKFDGDDVDWEENFGMRFTRVHAKYLKDKGLEERSRSGMALGAIWAQNANTAPVITWAMIEVIQDPVLFAKLRKDVQTAVVVDPETGKQTLDLQTLMSLPLLASIYAESMRLHVSINLTRKVEADMELGGYNLKKGSIVQSPSSLGHLDEKHWAQPGHPAKKFWAERFIVYEKEETASGEIKTVPKFSMTGHNGNWYPYGGGISICAGRHFAKQEIMSAVAMLVLHFDIEFLEYVHMDGSKSDRGPRDDPRWSGTAATPPDRDLRIRWRRV